ncbi:hypothetical protein Tco_0685735 [Tanacetum coccineum]
MVIPEVTKLTAEVSVLDEKSSDDKVKENRRKKTAGRSLGRIIPGEDSYLEYPTLDNDEDPLEDEDDDEFMKRVKKTKVEKLSLVDHSKIDYIPFRKNFYIELKDIQKMTHDSFVYAVPFTLATIRAAYVCEIRTSYVSRQCTSSVGDNATPCLLRRLAILNLLDAEIKTLIATYDIPLDLRPRLPDSNFRMSILPAGNTAIASSSRAIPFHMPWRHPDSCITYKVPTSFSQDHIDRLKAHIVKLRDIPEGVLVQSGLSRVWHNPMCDPVLRRSDNTGRMDSLFLLSIVV